MAISSKKQNILVTLAAVGIIILSSLLTYYATVVTDKKGMGSQKGYQNITFTDAALACEKQTRSSYGNKIKTLIVDNHSSRYDERQFLYKVFMEMGLGNKTGFSNLHYVNCFVHSANGEIRKFEVFEADGEKSTKPDDGTNMFGFPKK